MYMYEYNVKSCECYVRITFLKRSFFLAVCASRSWLTFSCNLFASSIVPWKKKKISTIKKSFLHQYTVYVCVNVHVCITCIYTYTGCVLCMYVTYTCTSNHMGVTHWTVFLHEGDHSPSNTSNMPLKAK